MSFSTMVIGNFSFIPTSFLSTLSDKITFIVVAVVVLAFLILVHELGHFLTAVGLDVRVEKFSIGFGKPIVSFTRNNIEYILAYIPLGGYVKFYGEEIEDLKNSDNIGDPDHFQNQPIWKRFLITLAGPLCNILLAVLLFGLLSMVGIYQNTLIVERVVESSAAFKANIAANDKILKVNGETISTWEEFSEGLQKRTDQHVDLLMLRGEEEIELSFPLSEIGVIGVAIKEGDEHPSIDGITPGPALKGGLEVEDQIVSIDGQNIRTSSELVSIIKQSNGETLSFEVKRRSKLLTLDIVPEAKLELGIIPTQIKVQRGVIDAAKFGVEKTISTIQLLFYGISKLISRDIPANQIAGPIGILQFAGKAAEQGIPTLLGFIAFISINLGVLNLLPIPVLDGGHILFLTIESIIRKPLSLKLQEAAQKVGISLLLLLMVFAFYNDIKRLLF
ncbi:MAG: RIP metalloprotease RseP [Nitrospinota bacterium]